MKYLVRFAQVHESFRQAETDSLAELAGVQLEWVFYSDEVCVSRLDMGVLLSMCIDVVISRITTFIKQGTVGQAPARHY